MAKTLYSSDNQWAGIKQLAPTRMNSRRHVCIIIVDLINIHPIYTYKLLQGEYIKVVQNMYDGCTTPVRMLLGSMESFKVNVCLHQGSALNSLLFITVMDVISEEVGRGPPHATSRKTAGILEKSNRE